MMEFAYQAKIKRLENEIAALKKQYSSKDTKRQMLLERLVDLHQDNCDVLFCDACEVVDQIKEIDQSDMAEQKFYMQNGDEEDE